MLSVLLTSGGFEQPLQGAVPSPVLISVLLSGAHLQLCSQEDIL